MGTRGVGRILMMACVLTGTIARADAGGLYLDACRRFADTVLEHGRDTYGPKHTPLFVSQLDIDTKQIPPATTQLYGRGSRGGAGPTTNNLEFDSGLVRLLDALSRLTGEKKYSDAARGYLSYCLAHE